MGAIASVDDLVAKMSGGSNGNPQNIFWHKTGRVAGAAIGNQLAGKCVSAWLHEGFPGNASTPASLVYPTNVSSGGMKQTDPGGGRQLWLTALSHAFEVGGTVMLYDRIAQQGGLVGNVSTNQSVSSTITRYTNGIGNWLWAEISVQGGSPGSTTFHFDYTDENNASATTYETQIGAVNYNSPYQMFFPGLAPVAGVGGRGVKNMTNFKLAGTNLGTGFDICAVIGHPLAFASGKAEGMMDVTNWLQGNLPVEILPDACLGLALLTVSSGSGFDLGSLHMIEA